MSVHAQSTIAHAVKKLSEVCVADENKDDGSGTEEEVASTLNESMNSMVLDCLEFTTTSYMRCAAYTLQLAIRDSLKIDTVASLIIRILQISAAVRTPKIDAIF